MIDISKSKLQERLEQLREEFEKDFPPITAENIFDPNVFNFSSVKRKWVDYEIVWKEIQHQIFQSERKKYREIRHWIEENNNRVPHTESEWEIVMMADERYKTEYDKLFKVKNIVHLISRVLETIEDRKWNIKHAIDILKYKDGF